MPLPLLCCLIGLGFTLVVTVIGALLGRSIGQMDKKLDDNCAAVSRLGTDMRGYEMLADHLKEKNKELEGKVETLTAATTAFPL